MTVDNFKPNLDELLKNGYTKISLPLLDQIKILKAEIKKSSEVFEGKNFSALDQIHLVLEKEKINDYRLNIIKLINKGHLKEQLLAAIAPFFQYVLGEDLAFQKNLNLMLVTPQDKTSILPLHADTWTGHSKFELAILFPLTEIIPEQNMFILPLNAWRDNQDIFSSGKSLQEITQSLKASFHFLNLQLGEALIFWHNLPHGNSVNESNQTHWSINLRVKNIFTPYMEKGLGDYFEPYKMSRFNEFIFKESTYESKNSRLHNQQPS